MTIISMSLDEKLLAELDKTQNELKITTRSQAIRAGLQLLLQEHRAETKLSGAVHAVLVVVHSHKLEERLTHVKHHFADIIMTQLHSHVRDEKCMDLFVLQGSAEKVRGMTREIKQKVKPDSTKLLLA